jgi:hypothetical protein
MNKTWAILFFLSCSFFLSAQEKSGFFVQGSIIDSIGNPVEYATVNVLAFSDSVYITGTVSDETGNYTIEHVVPGKYRLHLSHLLYHSHYEEIEISGNTKLPPVRLHENVKKLAEVTVTASVIRHEADRVIVSLKDNPITKGNTAASVLEWMPGVYKQNNAFKIYGQNVSRFYIDNRLVRDMKELDAIPAEQIDNVEVVYISGSEYSASASGGIIKIKLKKIPEAGYYGSVSGAFTINPHYGYLNDNINSAFNYRKNKWSIYNYFSYGDNRYVREEAEKRIFPAFDHQSIDMLIDNRGWNHSGADYLSLTCDLNRYHTIGINTGISIGKSPSTIYTTRSEVIDKNAVLKQRSASRIETESQNEQYQLALNYIWQLDNKGSCFKLIGDYLRRNQGNNINYEYRYDTLVSSYSEWMRSGLQQTVNMYEVDAKFEIKLGKNHLLGFGGNISGNENHPVTDYRELENNSWLPDVNMSDNYTLEGTNYAAYATFSSKWGQNFLYKLGIRVQQNTIAYDSHKIGEKNTRTYGGFYPTANLTYLINQSQGTSVRLSYRRSMNDIPYSAISPVVIYKNEYTYTVGNLNLKPAIYHFTQLITSIKNKWNISYYYLAGGGSVRFRSHIDENNPLITYRKPVNGGKSYSHALNLEGTFKINSWWTAKANADISRNKHRSNYEDWVDENQIVYRYYFTLNNDFRFVNDWGGNLSMNIEPTFRDEDQVYKRVYGVRGKIYKYLLNKKLLINVNLSIFNKNRTRIGERSNYWESYSNLSYYAPQFSVGITYSFQGEKTVEVKRSQSIQRYNEIKDN